MRRWLRLGPETHELRVVLTDLFDGGHTRTEYRCVGDDGRPLRGHRWDDLDGRRVDYDAASGRGCLVTGVFSTHRVWLDLERRPVVDGRLDCRLFDRRGERVARNRNRACPALPRGGRGMGGNSGRAEALDLACRARCPPPAGATWSRRCMAPPRPG